jgi:uncharacterized membrane protein YqjE
MEPQPSRSIGDLLRSLVRDIQNLVATQIELAVAEAQEKLRQAGIAVLFVSCGLLFVFSAWIVLLFALVTALSVHLPAWAAAGIVAVVTALVGGAFLAIGLRDLKADRLKPKRTLAVLRHEREIIKETLS